MIKKPAIKKTRRLGPLSRTPTRRYNDQRGKRRLETRIRVDYRPLVGRAEDLTVGDLHRAVATDVSEGGIFLGDAGYLKVGSLLHIFLRLPDAPASPVACFARVVRCDYGDRSGYGLRFLRLKYGDTTRLRRFVGVHLARARLDRVPTVC